MLHRECGVLVIINYQIYLTTHHPFDLGLQLFDELIIIHTLNLFQRYVSHPDGTAVQQSFLPFPNMLIFWIDYGSIGLHTFQQQLADLRWV